MVTFIMDQGNSIWSPHGRGNTTEPYHGPPDIAQDPPPLALLASRFPPDNRLFAPLVPDIAETVDHVEVIPGPDEHEVSVPPPRAPSLATDRADRREERMWEHANTKISGLAGFSAKSECFRVT
jgi:hypothetical protein